jgi:hypothetical protein
MGVGAWAGAGIPDVLLGCSSEGFPLRRTGLSLSGGLCSVSADVVTGAVAVAVGAPAGGGAGWLGFGVSDPDSDRASDQGRRSTGGLSWSSSRGAGGSGGLFFAGVAPAGSHFPSATHSLPR